MKRAGNAGRAGYTLVELMIIILIIATSVTAFAPGFTRAMADRRVSTAARELIRIGRRARSDTFGLLRAHLLWIDPANRIVQLLRGPTNSCTLTGNWTSVAADCPATPLAVAGSRCVESLFLSAMSGSDQPIGLFEETAAGTAYSTAGRALCYAPSGIISYGTGANLAAATATALATTNPAGVAGGFIFVLVDGTAAPITADVTTRVHRVLFSLGGTARSVR